MTAPLYRYDGEAKTLQEWADEHDLPIELVETRLASGWVLAEALQSRATIDNRPLGIEIPMPDGGYLDIRDASENCGIPFDVLVGRVVRGWDLRAVAKVRPRIGDAQC